MEEVKVVDHENEISTKISKLSISEAEEETLNFVDSLDHYLILIDSLSNTLLRQGWLELAGARYSMGTSRVNTALLNLQPHSAATTVEITHDQDGSMTKSPKFKLCKWASLDNKDSSLEKESIEEDEQLKENISSQRDSGSLKKSPKFSLCKWASPDNKDSSLKKENIEEDEQLKENVSSQRDSGNQESSPESSIESITNASPRESNGSEINASPRKIENPLQKERAKVLSMFGTLVSPKLRASQLTFETALETLVEIANARTSILKSYEVLHGDMKSTKE